jgi:hypothetical protein
MLSRYAKCWICSKCDFESRLHCVKINEDYFEIHIDGTMVKENVPTLCQPAFKCVGHDTLKERVRNP